MAFAGAIYKRNDQVKILVTGAAGFIGFHSVLRLLSEGYEVVGLDNLSDYYDISLKQARLAQLQGRPGFSFYTLDLADRQAMAELFSSHAFDQVLHLAAQAGVRYSLENPFAYLDSNLTGMLTILEGCRHHGIQHLVYASSSSVYGTNSKLPFSVDDRVDTPVSLYAATKKADELMSHAYAHLYGFPITGLRFFTVYGPWGRPDMAYFKFADAIMAGRPIDVYNQGDMLRDFTYIDDVIDGVLSIIKAKPEYSGDSAPHRVYNLGHNKPEKLLDMIDLLESQLGIKARKNFLPMQPGDVYATYADIDKTRNDFGFYPKTELAEGLARFVDWYREYCQAKLNS